MEMYDFYYTYQEEIYGVLNHDEDSNELEVELLRTGEKEIIDANWLFEQIKKRKIDYGKDKDSLVMYKKEYLSDHLKTSA